MISLLDCTLRDGGYVNDWEFGRNNIINIFERLVDSHVDMIEVGFLDERRAFDINRTIMPDTASLNKIFAHLDKKNASIIAMIDYGTCGIQNIQPCEETFIDGIRVIFKKHLREPALKFCAELKEKGYNVYAQLVSITSYSDDELLDLIRLANNVEPYAVSMVDTYGLMHQNNLLHYFNMLNSNLKPNISIGYHGHNNFQMGYANCISMISQAEKIDRDLIVDGTIYGMGKSAGNAPLELIMMHLNRMSSEKYDISQVLEAIDSSVMEFYRTPTWGYNLFFYIAALNNCHPNYVSFLLNKRTLSIKSVNDILGSLSDDKALLYDEKYVEGLYLDYQKNTVNDEKAIAILYEKIKGRNILLLGPETRGKTKEKAIKDYIRDYEPVIITINRIDESIEEDFVFLCNSKRYLQMASLLSRENHCIVATSNLIKTGKNEFRLVINYESLLEKAPIVSDSAIIMILKLLSNSSCGEIALAGLAGYSSSTSVEFSKEKGADQIINISEYINTYIMNYIESIGNKKVKFLTRSKFERK